MVVEIGRRSRPKQGKYKICHLLPSREPASESLRTDSRNAPLSYLDVQRRSTTLSALWNPPRPVSRDRKSREAGLGCCAWAGVDNTVTHTRGPGQEIASGFSMQAFQSVHFPAACSRPEPGACKHCHLLPSCEPSYESGHDGLRHAALLLAGGSASVFDSFESLFPAL